MKARVAVALLVTSMLVFGSASAAVADPAKPTNAQSKVLSIDPPIGGIQVDIVGGEGFVRLRVPRGTDVMVLGYAGERYVEVRADATVWVNQRSPAVGINRRRDASSGPQPGADSRADAAWKVVGHDGTYLWHDHRVHYMGSGQPPRLATWELTLWVNSSPVTVHGELHRLDAPTAWPWQAIAVALTVVVSLTLWRRPRLVVPALLVGGVAGLVVGLSEVVHLPSVAQPGPRSWALPVAVLVLVAVGVVAWRPLRRPALAGAGVALVAWGFLRRTTLTHRLLITGLPTWLERLVVVSTLAVGAAATLVLVARIVVAQSSPNHAGARSSR
jgi:hypothetical protein